MRYVPLPGLNLMACLLVSDAIGNAGYFRGTKQLSALQSTVGADVLLLCTIDGSVCGRVATTCKYRVGCLSIDSMIFMYSFLFPPRYRLSLVAFRRSSAFHLCPSSLSPLPSSSVIPKHPTLKGVNVQDILKLKNSGICTILGVAQTTRKNLLKIKV
jgi:hypothetical protein